MTPPPAGHCRSCGEPADELVDGMCLDCDAMAEEATIANQNGRMGLGFRMF